MNVIVEIISNKAEFFIGALALFLAVRAYISSELAKYENIKSLCLSLRNELEFQSSWIAGVYTTNHVDKIWFSPQKIVFVLSFESSKELMRRGVFDEKFIQSVFYKTLASFNERIEAFNNAVKYQQELISSNPVLSQKLIEYLHFLKISDAETKFCDVYLKIYDSSSDNEIKLLAKQLYQGNYTIHSQLIGDGSSPQYLNYMHREMNSQINDIISNYQRKLPLLYRKLSSFKP